jgi:O-antigen/teichoic acid export membrane protein
VTVAVTSEVPPATQRLDRGAVVARNVGLNFVGQLWLAVLGVVTTPYIVRTLGVDMYGLYVIVSAVLGYFAFLDLGLGAAVTKYVAEYHGVGDGPAVNRVLQAAFGAYLILGGAGALVIAAATTFLVDHVLTVNPADVSVAHVAFYIAALGFLVNLPAQTFSVVPAALQRFDVVVLRTILFGTASVVGTIGVLALGYGLREVLLVNLAITVATAVSFYFKTRTLLPETSFWPRLHRRELRMLTGFGFLKAVQRISTQVVFQLDRLVVGAFAPIAAVAYYAVPLSLSQRILKLAGNVGVAVFPAASALSGRNDTGRVEELYLRAMKLTLLIALPTSSMMFIYSHEIMRYWLNAEFEAKSSLVLMVLAAANLLYALTTVPAVTLDATGRIRVATLFGLFAAATNLVFVFVLVPTIGFQGAAWAILANSAVQVPLLLSYVHARVLSMSLLHLARFSLGRPLLSAALLWPLMVWARGLVFDVGTLALLCVGTALAYFGVTVLVGTYDQRDRAVVRSVLRRRPR